MGNSCAQSSTTDHVQGQTSSSAANVTTDSYPEGPKISLNLPEATKEPPSKIRKQAQLNNDIPSLLETLQHAATHFSTVKDERELTTSELKQALHLYTELKRILSVTTRTGDIMARPTSFRVDHHSRKSREQFRPTFEAFMNEFDAAEQAQQELQRHHPAAVKPIAIEALQEVKDFFILDNSLRETTVGAPRGHTLEEKHKIVDVIADTGLEEIILGSFGGKIAVDSQIAERWRELDSTWGFSDAYDLEEYDEDELWSSVPEFVRKESEEKGTGGGFYTPPANPKHKYSKADIELFQKASKGFQKGSYPSSQKPRVKVLKQSESKQGRIPLGLLMMKGYGISNAIVEVDTTVETFDYNRYDVVERCKYLIQWCKENLPRRKLNIKEEEDDTPRVLINLRDFSNFNRSKGGTEEALRLVDALSRLPPSQQPFGFIMEEPTGWLLPHEVGRLVRMVRLTMQRAGFPQGRFLVHLHWYFGLAEACQLACMANGADGVWAAVCRAGAQTGHACSTVTAVNLFKAGHHEIGEKYNLQKMCKAAREVTEITTREPCPSHEEVYGEFAFGVPYFMTNIPSCRYSLGMLISKMGLESRKVRAQ